MGKYNRRAILLSGGAIAIGVPNSASPQPESNQTYQIIGYEFDTFAEMSGCDLGYGNNSTSNGNPDATAAGDYWAIKGRYLYIVMPEDSNPGADGYHLKTQHGVKLRVVGPHYSLAAFGATGDSVSDDTTAWSMFQSVVGLKEIPPGKYLINGAIHRFDQGVRGNGAFDDRISTWDQASGDKMRDSIFVHQNIIDADRTEVSPVLKTQTSLSIDRKDPDKSDSFKTITGAYFEESVHGIYNTRNDTNQNFTTLGVSAENKVAGLFGTLAITGRYTNVSEKENPDLNTYLGNKGGVAFFHSIQNQKYATGGYSFGLEIYMQNGANETDAVPYENNDFFKFTQWTSGIKISAVSSGAPTSAALFTNALSGGKHGFWNGIVIGSTSFRINDQTQGVDGTVGVNMASWRSSTAFADIGIKFRTANRHLYFVEGAKIRSSLSRYIYDEGACGLSLEGADANGGYISIKDGATTASAPSTTEVGRFSATSARALVQSSSGHIQLTANGSSYYVSDSAIYPATNAARSLGTASYLWSQLYASTAMISTSDARCKQDIADLPDAVLDAWGTVDFQQFRFRDAAAQKGNEARLHSGVIAQRVVDAFAAAGLNAADYGLLCRDEWGAQKEVTETVRVLVTPEQVDEEGNISTEAVYENQTAVIVPAREAGDRYGIRYEEALCLEAAYQRRRADRLERSLADLVARVTALEGAET